MPDLACSRFFILGISEPLRLSQLNLGVGQHFVSEDSVLARVGGEGLVELLEVGSVTQVVHFVVPWLLLVHRNDSRTTIKPVKVDSYCAEVAQKKDDDDVVRCKLYLRREV